MTREIRKRGFWEFCSWYANWCRGCKHGCKYCYQMLTEVFRLQRMTYKKWTNYVLKENIQDASVKFKEGVGMLPTTHDIFPEIHRESINYLKKHLEVGNKILIVSKPWEGVISALHEELNAYKNQIALRFTITSLDQELLDFWEPNAPSLKERMSALHYAHEKEFNVSVLIEPFLDEDPLPLIRKVAPFTNEIWLGRMNHLAHVRKLVSEESPEYQLILKAVALQNLIRIVRTIDNDPELQTKIRYKDSFDRIREIAKNQSITKWMGVKT